MNNQNYQPENNQNPNPNPNPNPNFGNPMPGQPVNDGNGFSIAALICGILGIIGSWIPVVTYFTTVFAILGLILGLKGRKMSIAAYGKPSGMATAGFVLGIIGCAFAVLGLICVLACAGVVGSITAGM